MDHHFGDAVLRGHPLIRHLALTLMTAAYRAAWDDVLANVQQRFDALSASSDTPREDPEPPLDP